jgi:hypothetical protein
MYPQIYVTPHLLFLYQNIQLYYYLYSPTYVIQFLSQNCLSIIKTSNCKNHTNTFKILHDSLSLSGMYSFHIILHILKPYNLILLVYLPLYLPYTKPLRVRDWLTHWLTWLRYRFQKNMFWDMHCGQTNSLYKLRHCALCELWFWLKKKMNIKYAT